MIVTAYRHLQPAACKSADCEHAVVGNQHFTFDQDTRFTAEGVRGFDTWRLQLADFLNTAVGNAAGPFEHIVNATIAENTSFDSGVCVGLSLDFRLNMSDALKHSKIQGNDDWFPLYCQWTAAFELAQHKGAVVITDVN